MDVSLIPFLRTITPPEHMPYFESGQHLWVEKMDTQNNVKALQEWVSKDAANMLFLRYWIQKTTPVFGEWNWTKHKKADMD